MSSGTVNLPWNWNVPPDGRFIVNGADPDGDGDGLAEGDGLGEAAGAGQPVGAGFGVGVGQAGWGEVGKLRVAPVG